ncbi:MAG: hypothetical protein M5U08_08310 [Burkholderiales bacterium]|nr:hypothetical protein [Burkholderiales bacterium]
MFYFNGQTRTTQDISALDTEPVDSGLDGWGGLSEFSGRINETVARVAANSSKDDEE